LQGIRIAGLVSGKKTRKMRLVFFQLMGTEKDGFSAHLIHILINCGTHYLVGLKAGAAFLTFSFQTIGLLEGLLGSVGWLDTNKKSFKRIFR
jgi:hypothetical protein